MEIYQYIFSLNPDIADSELVKKIQNTLKLNSRDSNIKNNYDALSMQEFVEKHNYIHEIKSYTLERRGLLNSTDIIAFKRIKDDSKDLFEISIDVEVRGTPHYFRDILDFLGANREKRYGFNILYVPEASRKMFKDYLQSEKLKSEK